MKRASRWAVLFLVLTLGGCVTAADAYVDADRATYEAVAPEYLKYIEADATLNAMQKQIRRDNVAAWRVRIDKAGGFKR